VNVSPHGRGRAEKMQRIRSAEWRRSPHRGIKDPNVSSSRFRVCSSFPEAFAGCRRAKSQVRVRLDPVLLFLLLNFQGALNKWETDCNPVSLPHRTKGFTICPSNIDRRMRGRACGFRTLPDADGRSTCRPCD